MSYILDALRRAERERHRENGGAASEVANAAPPPPAKSRLRIALILAGVAIIVLLAANLVMLLLRQSGNTSPTAPTTTADRTAGPASGVALPPVGHAGHSSTTDQPGAKRSPAPADTPSTAHGPTAHGVTTLIPAGTSTVPRSATPNPIADAGSIHSMDQLTQPTPVDKAGTGETSHQNAIKPRQATPTTIASNNSTGNVKARPELASDQNRQPDETTPDTGITTTPLVASTAAPAKTTVAASTEDSAATVSTPSTQDLGMMPDSYRANFPRIQVQVHVYDPDPAHSWVLIGGKRYHAGDTLPQGPKIDKIVPEGIVFDWKNRHVLLPN